MVCDVVMLEGVEPVGLWNVAAHTLEFEATEREIELEPEPVDPTPVTPENAAPISDMNGDPLFEFSVSVVEPDDGLFV